MDQENSVFLPGGSGVQNGDTVADPPKFEVGGDGETDQGVDMLPCQIKVDDTIEAKVEMDATLPGPSNVDEQMDGEPNIQQISEMVEAVEKNNVKRVRQLLSRRFNIKCCNKYEAHNSMLHIAANNDSKGVAEELLKGKWNVNINAQNDHGDTPLHHAAGKHHHEMMHLLLEKGASSRIKNCKGETFLDAMLSFDCQCSNLKRGSVSKGLTKKIKLENSVDVHSGLLYRY